MDLHLELGDVCWRDTLFFAGPVYQDKRTHSGNGFAVEQDKAKRWRNSVSSDMFTNASSIVLVSNHINHISISP